MAPVDRTWHVRLFIDVFIRDFLEFFKKFNSLRRQRLLVNCCLFVCTNGLHDNKHNTSLISQVHRQATDGPAVARHAIHTHTDADKWTPRLLTLLFLCYTTSASNRQPPTAIRGSHHTATCAPGPPSPPTPSSASPSPLPSICERRSSLHQHNVAKRAPLPLHVRHCVKSTTRHLLFEEGETNYLCRDGRQHGPGLHAPEQEAAPSHGLRARQVGRVHRLHPLLFQVRTAVRL